MLIVYLQFFFPLIKKEKREKTKGKSLLIFIITLKFFYHSIFFLSLRTHLNDQLKIYYFMH